MIFRPLFAISLLPLLFLASCDKSTNNSNQTTIDTTVEAPEDTNAEMPDSTFCATGLVVKPLNISGTSWNEGIGRSVPSLILAPNTLDPDTNPANIMLNHEADARAVKTYRTDPRGNQILVFEGPVIDPDSEFNSACVTY